MSDNNKERASERAMRQAKWTLDALDEAIHQVGLISPTVANKLGMTRDLNKARIHLTKAREVLV